MEWTLVMHATPVDTASIAQSLEDHVAFANRTESDLKKLVLEITHSGFGSSLQLKCACVI
jgi:hypothetical protein